MDIPAAGLLLVWSAVAGVSLSTWLQHPVLQAAWRNTQSPAPVGDQGASQGENRSVREAEGRELSPNGQRRLEVSQ